MSTIPATTENPENSRNPASKGGYEIAPPPYPPFPPSPLLAGSSDLDACNENCVWVDTALGRSSGLRRRSRDCRIRAHRAGVEYATDLQLGHLHEIWELSHRVEPETDPWGVCYPALWVALVDRGDQAMVNRLGRERRKAKRRGGHEDLTFHRDDGLSLIVSTVRLDADLVGGEWVAPARALGLARLWLRPGVSRVVAAGRKSWRLPKTTARTDAETLVPGHDVVGELESRLAAEGLVWYEEMPYRAWVVFEARAREIGDEIRKRLRAERD